MNRNTNQKKAKAIISIKKIPEYRKLVNPAPRGCGATSFTFFSAKIPLKAAYFEWRCPV
jgi:hypothetical protein